MYCWIRQIIFKSKVLKIWKLEAKTCKLYNYTDIILKVQLFVLTWQQHFSSVADLVILLGTWIVTSTHKNCIYLYFQIYTELNIRGIWWMKGIIPERGSSQEAILVISTGLVFSTMVKNMYSLVQGCKEESSLQLWFSIYQYA